MSKTEQTFEQSETSNSSLGVVMPRFLFRYKCLDEHFKVEIKAENLNKAMLNFATYYNRIQEIYSVVRVP